MGTTEIIIIVAIVLIVVVFVVVGFDNGKKIKAQQQKEKEKAKAEAEKPKAEAKPAESASVETKQKVKAIVEENSIAVENYIKETLLKDELEQKNANSTINFEEVSESEVKKQIDSEQDDNAIIIGKKQTVLHTFAEDDEEESYLMGNQSNSIIDELDNASDAVISKKFNKFNIETNEEENEKTVGEEINSLSNKAKTVIISGVLENNDD